MARQTTADRKAKREKAKAEAFIEAMRAGNEEQPEKPKRTRRPKGTWPCTAEDVVRERDTKGLSWRQVATNLGLGSPGQARSAYTELTGRPHHESQPIVKRAPKGTVGRVVDSPGWDDESDQDAIQDRLNGEWVEASGEGQNYSPAHWSGSSIVVQHRVAGSDFTFDEEVDVAYVVEFSFGKEGDQPLQVSVIEKTSRGFRTFFVASIMEVR